MYHTSEHYRALIENGAVDVARSMEELVASTIDILQIGSRRSEAMRKTLRQKVASPDGNSAKRFAELVTMLSVRQSPAADLVDAPAASF
jgi:hypothetical protein